MLRSNKRLAHPLGFLILFPSKGQSGSVGKSSRGLGCGDLWVLQVTSTRKEQFDFRT